MALVAAEVESGLDLEVVPFLARHFAALAPDAILLIEIDEAVLVLDDRARRRTREQTTGLLAVMARVLLDQPLEVAIDLDFVEPHQ